LESDSLKPDRSPSRIGNVAIGMVAIAVQELIAHYPDPMTVRQVADGLHRGRPTNCQIGNVRDSLNRAANKGDLVATERIGTGIVYRSLVAPPTADWEPLSGIAPYGIPDGRPAAGQPRREQRS
jgi:hypothetical protein